MVQYAHILYMKSLEEFHYMTSGRQLVVVHCTSGRTLHQW